MNASATPATVTVTTKDPAPTATVAAPIPFRSTSAVSAPELLWVFMITLLLLASVAALAAIAKRRGWLNRWLGRAGAEGKAAPQLEVLERLAISRQSTLFRVRHAQGELIVVESSAQVQLTSVSPRQEPTE